MKIINLREENLGYAKIILTNELVIGFPYTDVYLILESEIEREIFREFINGFSKIISKEERYSNLCNSISLFENINKYEKPCYIVPFRINDSSNESLTCYGKGEKFFSTLELNEIDNTEDNFLTDIKKYTDIIKNDENLLAIIEDTTLIDNDEGINLLIELEKKFLALAEISLIDYCNHYTLKSSITCKYQNIKMNINSSPKVIIFCGCSDCGKNYIEKLVTENNGRIDINFEKIRQCTTRKCRDEEDKSNYDFIDDEEYDKKVELNKLFGRTSIRDINNPNNYFKYGSYIDDIINPFYTEKTILTIILNAKGIEDFLNKIDKYFNNIDILILNIKNSKINIIREDRDEEFLQKEIEDLEKVLKKYKNKDNITILDLKNEPDCYATKDTICNIIDEIKFI